MVLCTYLVIMVLGVGTADYLDLSMLIELPARLLYEIKIERQNLDEQTSWDKFDGGVDN